MWVAVRCGLWRTTQWPALGRSCCVYATVPNLVYTQAESQVFYSLITIPVVLVEKHSPWNTQNNDLYVSWPTGKLNGWTNTNKWCWNVWASQEFHETHYYYYYYYYYYWYHIIGHLSKMLNNQPYSVRSRFQKATTLAVETLKTTYKLC